MKIFSIFVLVLSALNSPHSCFAGINPQYTPPDDSLRIIEKALEAVRTIVEYEGTDSLGKGGYGYSDGAISIILKDDKDIVNNSVFHSVNVKFSGFDEPRIFYSPRHHTKLESDYKPDLRTTLFWEPNIKVENNKDFFVNYFNADNPSKVKVIVEGITSAGIPVTGKTEYEVR